jgi:ankyrin repeat protein
MCFVVEGGRLFSDARCCRDGRAPIHGAASGGHLSCLEFLVGRNADVNARDE